MQQDKTDTIDNTAKTLQITQPGQDTTDDNTASDTYIRDALDNFKAVHIVIPLLPEAPSNRLDAIPHLFWCPAQNPFSPIPGTERNLIQSIS